MMEILPVLLLLVVLCGLDWALYSIFDTIRRHSFLQYSFRSEPAPPGDTPLENSHPWAATHPNSPNFVTSLWISAPLCPPQGQV